MNNLFFLYITDEACSNYMPFLKILARITSLIGLIVQIIIPIILLILGIIGIILAIIKKKSVKQSFIKLLKYIVIGFLLFMIVQFIKTLTLSSMCDGYYVDGKEVMDDLCCWELANVHQMYMEKTEVYTLNKCSKNEKNIIKIGKEMPNTIKQYNTYDDLEYEYEQRQIYLKQIIWDGKIKYSKIYFYTGPDMIKPGIAGTFSIDGKYKSEYKSNKDTLIRAFGKPNCKEQKKSIECYFEGLYVRAYRNGHVEAENEDGKCYVTKDGTSCCIFNK